MERKGMAIITGTKFPASCAITCDLFITIITALVLYKPNKFPTFALLTYRMSQI